MASREDRREIQQQHPGNPGITSARSSKKWVKIVTMGVALITLAAIIYIKFQTDGGEGPLAVTESYKIIDVGETDKGEKRVVIRYQGYPKAIPIDESIKTEGIKDLEHLSGAYVTRRISDKGREIEAVKITSQKEE